MGFLFLPSAFGTFLTSEAELHAHYKEHDSTTEQ